MGYRDSLDPTRARIADLREELQRHRERVLPTFWRLPEARVLARELERVGRISEKTIGAATFDELVQIESQVEHALQAFEREIALARSVEASGAMIPAEPDNEDEGQGLAAFLSDLAAGTARAQRNLGGIEREIVVELLQKTRDALPSGARASVSTRDGEWLVRVSHQGVTFRVCFTRKFRAKDIDPFILFTTVAVPIGTPRIFVKPRSYLDDWLETLGVDQVHTGHEAFDQLFTLKGDADFLHEIFDADLRHAVISAQSIDETRIDVHHGFATIYGRPRASAFEVLSELRHKLHTERYLRSAS